MPTVILFDCSLSMLRPIVADDPSSESRRVLAEQGVSCFLDSLKTLNPLEYVSLLKFSSSCEVVVPFTREVETVRAGLVTVDTSDKTLLQRAIRGAGEHLLTEFGPYAPCHVVVVTDGSQGGNNDDVVQKSQGQALFPVPASVHVVLVARGNEISPAVESFYRGMCGLHVSNPGDVILPDDPTTLYSVDQCMKLLAEKLYVPFNGHLTCGHLSANVCLVPRPFFLPVERAIRHTACCASSSAPTVTGVAAAGAGAGDSSTLQLPTALEVCGFLELSSVAGPPILARHLVLDSSNVLSSLAKDTKQRLAAKDETSEGEVSSQVNTGPTARSLSTSGAVASDGESSAPLLMAADGAEGDVVAPGAATGAGAGAGAGTGSVSAACSGSGDGRVPSFRVLLHASLRVESLVALVRFRDDWFGLLMSAADSKKKANLVLSVFAPGCELPWLGGRLAMLGPSALLQQESGLTRKRKHSDNNPDHSDSEQSEYRPTDYLPVPPITPPSFNSQSGLTWARQQNIQNDVQKVVRFAKRLPDKINSFLRETNRLRHTALCYGLTQLLEVLSNLVLREQSSYPPDSYAQQQLAFVANALLSQKDPDKPITLQPVAEVPQLA